MLGVAAVTLPMLDVVGLKAAHWVGQPQGAPAGIWPSALVGAVLTRVVRNMFKREGAGGAAADPSSTPSSPGESKPKRKLQLPFAASIAELVAGPLLLIVALGYLSAFAANARKLGPFGSLLQLGTFDIRPWQVFLGGASVLLLVGWSVDAVNWSMHRFYKRRLWSAFAYDDATHGERNWSQPTKLSTDAVQLGHRPELVLCGAAQVSGPELAPPRRRAVTWTFDSHWVGGPEVGWCETSVLEHELDAHGKGGDVSMFGAIAICGAAFGSAMGRHSMGSLNAVFALTNARLGVWLPNPGQVGANKWKYKRRHLGYVAREVFGRYPPSGRWMLVSDGGHYENLGLVELFRRRCTRILCFDATGDDTGAVTTVAEALRLAEEELGVRVYVADPWATAPGGTTVERATQRLADALDDRMARATVAAERVVYHEESGLPAGQREGWLVIGRAVLDQTTPWPVLSYSVGNDVFPNDPTSDQWFDHEQFANYRLLGRHVAARVLDEVQTPGGRDWWS